MASGSPTLLNLRDFRIQKKSVLSSSQQSSSSSPESPPSNKVRRRIIHLSDSDSEAELKLQQPQQNHVSKPYEKKDNHVIIIPDLAKNKMTTKPQSVIDKERKIKYLLENFPGVDTMVVHDLLNQSGFDCDSTAQKLSNRLQCALRTDTFAKWEQDNYTASANGDNHKRSSSHASNPRPKKKIKRRRHHDDALSASDEDDSFTSKAAPVFDSDSDDSEDNETANSPLDISDSSKLSGDRRAVLEFLQTASETELMWVCSKAKAAALTLARPFVNWLDLVTKLRTERKLGTDVLNATQQALAVRRNVKQLMKRCTGLAARMERAVAAGAGVRSQPRNLSGSLRLTNYQMVGLNWLAVLHAQNVNGILADEMGLGKTVQVIAFLAYLKETRQSLNTHLVVVPSSTLDNWKSEFARWCPELRVFMYYGSTEERKMFRIDFSKGILSDFDVILTTYTLVGNSPEERKMFRVTRMHYVIFDEAHMLKNMNTQRYENLIKINAKHRILLTGTPLQNNLLELMSLLIFVMPKMFAEKSEDLKSLFQKNSKAKSEDTVPAFEREQIEQAKRIMKPFVLRRLKSEVLQDLPPKKDRVIKVPMAPTQREQYDNLVASYKNAGEGHAYNGMSIMTDLRKLSNHPLLMRYHYDEEQITEIAAILANDPTYKDTVVEYIVQDLLFMSDFDINKLCKIHRRLDAFILPDNLMLTSGKFLYLDHVLPELRQMGHRVLIFSQYVIMLNILEVYMRLRKHRFLRLDGSTPVSERQELIDKYTQDSSIFVFLLSTRAGGLGINLTAADTVIIHDIDFNPYNDKQAEDRCHRIGQTRPVSVYRLIAGGSIEEGMLEMNREKLKLERQITSEEADNPDTKSVVRLLSSVLGIDSSKALTYVSPDKQKPDHN